MESVNCVICNSSECVFLYEIPDLMLERAEVSGTFVRCSNCGLIYQNPRPDDSEMASHYPAQYFLRREHPKKFVVSQWISNYGLWKRSQRVLRQKAGGTLVDVGCASGSFLGAMRPYLGWNLIGVEPNSAAAESARCATGLNVINGTLEQANLPDQSMDVATLWDVIEHLPNPAKTLDELYRILKPDGLLFLRFPNVDSHDARLFGPRWVGWESPRHLYVFSRETMQLLLDRHGFYVVERSSGIGDYPDFVLSVRFWLAGKNVRAPLRRSLLWSLNSLPARVLMAPVFALRSRGANGPELMITARKR